MGMRPWSYLLCCLALLSAPGCRLFDEPPSVKSPLQAAKPSSDSVGLEIFFAQLPSAVQAKRTDFWQEVDEQQLPSELRKSLAQNGFRAGVVSCPLSEQLCDILKLSETAVNKPRESKPDLLCEPAVTKRLLQTRAGHRGEIIASSVYEDLPLLSRENGQVRGRTYHKAECRFALKAAPASGNLIQLELLPEVQHGDQQLRKVIGEGTVRLEPGRPRITFEQLMTRVNLGPGQVLVLGSMPDMPGSLGHYFFTDAIGGKPTRKILLIRLAQAAEDELFSGGQQVPHAAALDEE